MSKTRKDLVDFIAERAAISKADAENAVTAMIDCVEKTLVSGDKVTLAGFGTWETSRRAARNGRNPQTGETVQIPAATVPKFKAAKRLKDAVNTQ